MKKRILSLMLTVSMLLSMCALGFNSSAAETGSGENEGSVLHEIYWTRSVEYSPWLASGDGNDATVSSVQLPNPEATNFTQATGNYLGQNADKAEFGNPYILNLGDITNNPNPPVVGDGYQGTDKVNDLEETINDRRMRIAYVDPYFRTLQNKANAVLSSTEASDYYTLYDKIVEAVRATTIDPDLGTGTNQALLANPVGTVLTAAEQETFATYNNARYAALTKAEAAVLKLYESDYNKAPEENLTYNVNYIWDGGYCPIGDNGGTTEQELSSEPTTPVGTAAGGIPTFDYNTIPTLNNDYKYVGDLTDQAAANNYSYYYVDGTGREGNYAVLPAGGYVKLNGTYYVVNTATYYQLNWQITMGYLSAVDTTDPNNAWLLTATAPTPGAAETDITDYTLNKSATTLNVAKRVAGTYAGTVESYQSDYIALGSVTPSSGADFSNVTVSYSIVSGSEYITLGTPSASNPYAVKVTAKQDVAQAGTAVVRCTLTSGGNTITKDVTVNVTTSEITETVDPEYGIYCRGWTGELGNNSTELRHGRVTSQGQWATWMSYVDPANQTYSGPIETVRRFTGYVYLSENEFRSGNTLYLSALDDVLISGDDSFSIVINGVPFVRADIAYHNNYQNDAGQKFEAERSQIVRTVAACPQGANCSVEGKRTDYMYGGATVNGPWHAHLDTSTLYEATGYLKPGANRIDIITGDVSQGGGMSRLYLFSSEDTPFNGKLKLTVKVYTDPSCDEQYLVTEPLPIGTRVYYKYTVENVGTDTLHNVVIRDPTIGVIYESTDNGSGASYQHNAGIGPYGNDPYHTGTGEGSNTTYSYSNNSSTLSSDEVAQIADLYELLPGSENAKSVVVTTKWSGTPGSSSVTDQGASIIGEVAGTVVNTAYASADGGDEVQDTTNVSFVLNKIYDDYAVIDYGLPVTIPVLDNDGLSASGVDVNVISNNSGNAMGSYTPDVPESDPHFFKDTIDITNYGSSATGRFGTASVTSGKEVKYTPERIINDVDKFVYSVTKGEKNALAEVNVVPASSVYYEDTVIGSVGSTTLSSAYQSGKLVFVGAWQVVGNAVADLAQTYDNDAHYGYDDFYDIRLTNSDLYSCGQSHVFGSAPNVEVNGVPKTYLEIKNDTSMSAAEKAGYLRQLIQAYDKSVATMTFAFQGTGFDIISRCTLDSGTMKVRVYEKDAFENATIGDDGVISGISAVRSFNIDNVKEGNAFEQDQLPSLTIKDLEYGDYICQISVSKTFSQKSNGSLVYLDAVRIYDPLGDSLDIDKVNQYYTVAERNSIVYKIRDLILNNDATYGAGATDPFMNGGTRVDTNGNLAYYLSASFLNDDGTFTIEDASETAKYAQFGPKSEVYLKEYGDGFAFEYNSSAINSAPVLQIDAKIVGADAPVNGVALKVTNTATGQSKTVSVKSGTQMFYDFSELVPSSKSGTFVVQKASSDHAVISVTNIKIPKQTGNAAVLSSDVVKPTAIAVAGETSMYPNTTQRLSATVTPNKALYSSIIWSCENDKGVTIDQNGVLTVPDYNGDTSFTVDVYARVGSITSEAFTVTILPKPVYVSSISLTGPDTVYVGTSFDIDVAEILPANATDKSVTWTLSNDRIGTITSSTDSKATISANIVGNLTVTATPNVSESGVSASKTITIKAVPTDIVISCATASKGDNIIVAEVNSLDLTALYDTNDAIGGTVTWSSSDTSIATIDANGHVSFTGALGAVTFTASTEFNGNTFTDTFAVNATERVYTATVEIISADNVKVGSDLTLTAYVTTDSGDDTVTWSIVSGGEYATLSGSTLTGVAPGTVRVRATSNGVTTAYDEMDIEVGYVNTVRLVKGSNTGYFITTTAPTGEGGYTQVPFDGTFNDQRMTNGSTYYFSICNAGSSWTSHEPYVGVTLNNGVFTYQVKEFVNGHSEGGQWVNSNYFDAATSEYSVSFDTANGVIAISRTANASNPGSGSIDVTGGNAPAPTITISGDSSVAAGSTITLTATVQNSSSGVNWSSSDTSVATVNASGVVTGVAAGSATITATLATDSSVTATKTVTVTAPTPVPSVTISGDNSVAAGSTITLTATVQNSSSAVTWSSDNASVATVANGVVTGVAAGSATITATITDNGVTYSDSITVTVTGGSTPSAIDTVRLVKDSNTGYHIRTEALNGRNGYNVSAFDGTGYKDQALEDDTDYYFSIASNTASGQWIENPDYIKVRLSNGNLSYQVLVWNGGWGANSYDEPATTDYTVALDPSNGNIVRITRTAGAGNTTTSGTITGAPVVPTAIELASATVNSGADVIVANVPTFSLTATYNTGSAVSNPTWASSDTDIAAISNGTVTFTGNKFGPVSFTAFDGTLTSAQFTVTAYQKVYASSVTLSQASDSLVAGNTGNYNVTINGSAGQYQIFDDTFTAVSSDTGVATVALGTGATKSIVVTAVAPGTATITVTSGSQTATLAITVTAPVQTVSVYVSAASSEIAENGNTTVTATLTNSTAGVDWSVTGANGGAATLSANSTTGATSSVTVTGTSAGSVTVTATSKDDPTKSDSVTITITAGQQGGGATIPDWQTGTSYAKGDVVKFTNQKLYVCWYPGTYSPDYYGWYELSVDPTSQSIPAYVSGTTYATGAVVTRDGTVYAYTGSWASIAVTDSNFATCFTAVNYPS